MPQQPVDTLSAIGNVDTVGVALADPVPADVAAPEAEEADSLGVAVDSLAVEEAEVETPVVAEVTPPWQYGLLPVERPMRADNDQGFVGAIILFILGLSLSVKHISRVWGTLIKQLWETRTRRDFDHITAVERRTIVLMLVAAVFFIGLIGNSALALWHPAEYHFTFPDTLKICSGVALYFLFQFAVYFAVGYTFTTPEGRNLWIEGFTASMSLLGLMLILPGLVVVFYPSLTRPAIMVGAAFYILARILFIGKGFRIFYTNIGSIIYFILYLCTLELVPITILVNITNNTCSF